MTPTLTLGETIALDSTAGSSVSLTFGSGEYFAAWATDTVRRARILPDGTVLDPGGVALPTSTSTRRNPRIAAGPNGFILTWGENLKAQVAKIAVDGTLGTQSILFSSYNFEPPSQVTYPAPNDLYLVAFPGGRLTRMRPDLTTLESLPLSLPGSGNVVSAAPSGASWWVAFDVSVVVRASSRRRSSTPRPKPPRRSTEHRGSRCGATIATARAA